MVNQDVRDVKALVGQASYVHADRVGDDVGAALWCYPDLGMRLGGVWEPLDRLHGAHVLVHHPEIR